MLHPGRTFAKKQPCQRTPEQVLEELDEYYQTGEAPPEVRDTKLDDEAKVEA